MSRLLHGTTARPLVLTKKHFLLIQNYFHVFISCNAERKTPCFDIFWHFIESISAFGY